MHTQVRAHVNEADLSIISPIQIENRDAIALTECPGRSKDYTEAITRIIAWQPDLVVTLVEESEIAQGAYFGEAEHGFRLKSNRVSGGR